MIYTHISFFNYIYGDLHYLKYYNCKFTKYNNRIRINFHERHSGKTAMSYESAIYLNNDNRQLDYKFLVNFIKNLE